MPVILLRGNNAFEIDKAARGVRSAFSEIDTVLFDGATVAWSDLEHAARTAGLFDPERLVVVRGLGERLKGAKRDGAADELRRILSSVAPTTTVLLPAPDTDEKNPLVEIARAVGAETRAFSMPRRGDLPRWIAAQASSHGVTMRPDAAALLAEMLGTDSIMIDSEIEKLAVYAGEGGIITAEVVGELVGAITQDSIFALVDAVAAGDGREALTLLHRQIESSSTGATDFALYLIRMLARQMRILLRIRVGGESGKSRRQIADELKLNQYYSERYFRQAAKMTRVKLAGSFESLAALEHSIKSSRIDMVTALDLLVASLCS